MLSLLKCSLVTGVIACWASGVAALAAPANDFVIVPGVRIGALRLPATEADVVKAFPGHAVPVEIDLPEGGLERGTALYACDPDSTAQLHYRTENGRRVVASMDVQRTTLRLPNRCSEATMLKSPDPLLKGQSPGDTLDTSQYDWARRGEQEDSSEVPFAQQSSDKWPRPTSVWHLENGIRLGTDIAMLERLNGRPFDIKGPEGDGRGGMQWRGGRLAACPADVALGGLVQRDDTGKRYKSTDPSMRNAAVWVESLYVDVGKSSGVSQGSCAPVASGR